MARMDGKNKLHIGSLAFLQNLFFLVRIRRTSFMVLGIITSIVACLAIIGTAEAIQQGQRQNAREQHRRRKSNLLVSCSDPSRKARDVNGGTVVLRNNKLYVTTVNPCGKARRERRGDENEKDPN
ncbi:hypothetical protein V496_01527 [Pseudogymnoascus sp. VKM F-4515 (FW-2607)]|nr:hypothetical protein V496_01527 [Pseudogymnoascus sp. VKM F-4515 (FW-2607)]